MASSVRKRITVHGRVQAVGFRASTQMRADELGLTGFVRNLADGSVEAEIEGPPQAVSAMVDWLGCGPAYAEVSHLTSVELPPSAGTSFDVRP